MIIMVAVLCFLDDFMVICFLCEQETSQDFMHLPQSTLSSWAGPGRSRSIWCFFFSPLANRERPGACTCIALTLDMSMWVIYVVCTCNLEWVGRELQTKVIPQYSDSRSCARSVSLLLKGAAGTASVWQLLYYSNKFQLRFRPVAQTSNKKCLSVGNVWRDEMVYPF